MNDLVPADNDARIAEAANRVADHNAVSDYRAGRSKNTLRAQDADLERFSAFLAHVGQVSEHHLAETPEAWRHVSHGLVEAFKRHMLREGYAVSTVNRTLSTIRTYAQLAQHCIPADELAAIERIHGYKLGDAKNINQKRIDEGVATRKPEAKKRTPTAISKVHIKALIDDHPDTPQGYRDRLLMALLLYMGMRVSEVVLLEWERIDAHAKTLTFYRPKVSLWQTHNMPEVVFNALVSYAVYIPKTSTRILWTTTSEGTIDSEGMSISGVNRRVATLGKQVGLPTLSPHDCRHSWATRAARAGTDAFTPQQAGGWTSIATAKRYVEDAKIANEGLKLE